MPTKPLIIEYQTAAGKWLPLPNTTPQFDTIGAIKQAEGRVAYFRVRQGKQVLVCRER